MRSQDRTFLCVRSCIWCSLQGASAGAPLQERAKPSYTGQTAPKVKTRHTAGLQYQQSQLLPSQASVRMQHSLKPTAIHAQPSAACWQSATAMQPAAPARWPQLAHSLSFLGHVQHSSTAQNGSVAAASHTSSQSVFETPATSDTAAQQRKAVHSLGRSSSSLYACTPPGRPSGRRCAIVRWVLNQRALWREQCLTPQQLQYMTILGTDGNILRHLKYDICVRIEMG